uniref:Uncharacterized protein n=1 Tax=Arundo donax TaxID=35708 RepID=A0A0A9DG18_ARUDO
MQTSSIVSLASYAIGGGISKQKDIVSELDDVAVTEEDVMTNTIGTNETSEDSPVKVDEFGLSRQDNKRTKIDERHSASDHEIESNQQKKLMVTNPIDNFPIIVEPIESFTEKSVGTPDIVQPEHQLDSTPDHWAIPKEENNVVGPYYPSTEISSSTSSTVLPHEEGGNNTLGWKGTLLKYSISPPASMDNTYLMSKILLLHSLDKTLDVAPKNLRLAFDEHVNGIGNHIKDDVAYVQVISKILITELTPKYDFSEMFSDDLVLKIEEANRVASSYREKELTLYDRQIILGALDQLPIILAQIESLVMQIKLRLETVKKFDENEKEPDENSHGKNEDGREDEKLEKEKKPVWLHVMRLLVFGGIVVAMVSSGGNK